MSVLISPKNFFSRFLIVFVGLWLLNGCITDHRLPPSTPLPDAEFYALTDNNQLLRYNARSLGAPQSTATITGLEPGERILSIDFRPATGQLYGVSSSRLYVINPMTGAARMVGTAAFSPALVGSKVSIDFNPTVDRIRLVTNAGQNLRLHPELGTVIATDGSINGVPGAMISTIGYTNNKAGVTTSVLYDIDPVTDKLYRQDPPNNGTLAEVGPLNVDVADAMGFDISPNGDAIVVVRVGSQVELSQINIMTGGLQKLGNLPPNITGLAIPTEPVAFAVDGSNNLLIFNPMNPMPVSRAITGLQTGEMILGIDFRPATGQLFALGSSSRLYILNTSNGMAAAVGGAAFSTPLAGSDFGFDFNPLVDRIRVVSNTGQNLRLNPNDGTLVAVDGPLNPGTPVATASAYTNNFVGASTTILYNIDTKAGDVARLTQQIPPNNGTQIPVGILGFEVANANGFDIGGMSNMAYALLRNTSGQTKIYSVNLNTGAATPTSDFPGNPTIRGFAIGLGF